MADPHYTDEAIQDALKHVADRLGHVPSIQEYEKMREQILFAWMDENPDNMRAYCEGEANPFPLPSVMTIRSRFPKGKGGWEAAVSELRKQFPPQHRKGDLSFLGRVIGRMERTVSEDEYEKLRAEEAPSAPQAEVLKLGFGGTWEGVLEAAGLNLPHRRQWPEEQLLQMVVQLGTELGAFPSVAEYDSAAKARGWPASRQFYRKERFRSWIKVRQEAEPLIRKAMEDPNYKPNAIAVSRFAIRRTPKKLDLKPLKRLGEKLGRRPKIKEYQEARQGKQSWPSAKSLKSRFGSWAAVCDQAGLPEGPTEDTADERRYA